MRRNSYLGTSGQKSNPAIRSGDLDFIWDRCISSTEWRYWIYSMFFATTSHNLVTLTYDLLTLRVFRVQCISCLTHIPIFIILRLPVTELRVLNIWSHYLHLERSLRMRRVTWPITGGKNDPHFCNPWTQFIYWLCHLYGATTKIKPCYKRKIAFFHCEGYKVNSACAVSRDLCTGGLPKPHVPIFWPRIVYSLYNFYGAKTTLKGSFILEHPHVKAVFGRKNQVQSKSVPKMAVFRKFKGLNIKYQRHFLTRNDVFWRTLR